MPFSKSKPARTPLQRLSDQRRSLALAGLAVGAAVAAIFRRRKSGAGAEFGEPLPAALPPEPVAPAATADSGPPAIDPAPPAPAEPAKAAPPSPAPTYPANNGYGAGSGYPQQYPPEPNTYDPPAYPDQSGRPSQQGYPQTSYDQGGYEQGGGYSQSGYPQTGPQPGGYDQANQAQPGGYDQGSYEQGGYPPAPAQPYAEEPYRAPQTPAPGYPPQTGYRGGYIPPEQRGSVDWLDD